MTRDRKDGHRDDGGGSDSGSGIPTVSRGRRLLAFTGGLIIAGAFYLVLIDTTDLPELYAGAVIAVLCAVAFEAGREQGSPEAAPSVRMLLRGWRAVLRVPGDVMRVSLLALRQLVDPRAARGTFRAIPFRHGDGQDAHETARRALAEGLGSLAPNTIIVGIDPERDLILAHQLGRTGGPDAVDLLQLR